MPAWLELLLNLGGYAGFLALATRSASLGRSSHDDRFCGGKT